MSVGKLRIELSHKEKHYIVENLYLDEGTIYLWTEGNYSCDCNRSLFINSQCDENFPLMDCGEQIKLEGLIYE